MHTFIFAVVDFAWIATTSRNTENMYACHIPHLFWRTGTQFRHGCLREEKIWHLLLLKTTPLHEKF